MEKLENKDYLPLNHIFLRVRKVQHWRTKLLISLSNAKATNPFDATSILLSKSVNLFPCALLLFLILTWGNTWKERESERSIDQLPSVQWPIWGSNLQPRHVCWGDSNQHLLVYMRMLNQLRHSGRQFPCTLFASTFKSSASKTLNYFNGLLTSSPWFNVFFL